MAHTFTSPEISALSIADVYIGYISTFIKFFDTIPNAVLLFYTVLNSGILPHQSPEADMQTSMVFHHIPSTQIYNLPDALLPLPPNSASSLFKISL